MITEIKYADELIDKYSKITCLIEFGDSVKLSIECAIIDVNNTIKSLNEQYIEIWGKSKD